MYVFDCETDPIAPGYQVPDIIALGYCSGDKTGIKISPPYIPDWNDELVGFAVDFDLACIARSGSWHEVFDCYDSGKVVDLRTRILLKDYREIGMRTGRYSLDHVGKRYGVEHTCKDSKWRTRYNELRGVNPFEWPEEAQLYLLEDIRITNHIAQRTEPEVDERAQAKYAFALRLVQAWGMNVCSEKLELVKTDLIGKLDALRSDLREVGIVTDKLSVSKKAVQERVLASGVVRYTSKGHVQTSKEVLSQTDDPVLHKLMEYQQLRSVMTREVKLLEAATTTHTRYDLTVTGRTSSSGPNIQNLSKHYGIRECFTPREGYTYVHFDYPTLELRTLAQAVSDITSIKDNKLALAFRNGVDPHLQLAFRLLGRTGERGDPEIEQARALAKVLNFGLPGGLRGANFARYAKDNYGIEVDDPEGAERAWLAEWSEVAIFQKIMKQECRSGRPIQHLRSGRLRGHVRTTQAFNTLFQGLGSDVAKSTLYRLVKECYIGCMAPARVIAFVHDEFLLEAPVDKADKICRQMADVIKDEWSKWCPDVPVGLVEPKAIDLWTK